MQEEKEYWPLVESWTRAKTFFLGEYAAFVMTDVVAVGAVEYEYLMPVYRIRDQKLCLCVSSEKNRMYGKNFPGDGTLGMGESHFLGLFPGTGHLNLGSSNNWADLDRFTAKALEVARERLGVVDPDPEQQE